MELSPKQRMMVRVARDIMENHLTRWSEQNVIDLVNRYSDRIHAYKSLKENTEKVLDGWAEGATPRAFPGNEKKARGKSADIDTSHSRKTYVVHYEYPLQTHEEKRHSVVKQVVRARSKEAAKLEVERANFDPIKVIEVEETVEKKRHTGGGRSVADELAARRKKKEDGNWVPANGGTETPTTYRTGRRLLYVWQPSTGKHAYLDLATDIILSDEEAMHAIGMR